MSLTIENKIINKIKKAGRGSLFFTEDFVTFGNQKAVNKALERLVEKGEIKRVARGIYARPKTSNLVGELLPTNEEIAGAIAKRDKARIIPTGSYALNAIGLSTQIPMNAVFLTDGAARKIKIDNRTIIFKKTSPKNLATIGKISSLVIQALKEIGKNNVKEWEINKILEVLKKEEKTRLQHDIKLAPEWIRVIMKKAL
ncbi:MAG: type IV toxin-antitoxin system AbiEi family antitoxin domain-containing protein [Bacteroidales bacterium]|nr:type IV toxin-antitoxin system AbiEi family antitoxin domain-containing protein [Bacteroidales bacterium]